MEKLNQKPIKSNKYSKVNSILNYYYKNLYKNFNKSEIQSRIVDVNIYVQLIENTSWRAEYRTYIEPINWLPSTYIKNPASFFVLCMIHGFLPNIDSIIIKNASSKLNLTQYKKIVLINRMLHLFFVKWFNFVLYDVIKKFLKDQSIKELFESNNIEQLNESEVLSIVKLIEDIKLTWFDLHKHHFHDKLSKLFNEWTFSENIFLEVAMKYENKTREFLWYDATYIKPASYNDDTKEKIDFNWIYSINWKSTKYKSVPIQFTTSSHYKKLENLIQHFLRSKENEFIYLQADGNFRKNISKTIDYYKQWINNPRYRELQDPTDFPLFINHIDNNKISDIILLYFVLHHIIKHKHLKNIPKIKYEIWWYNFSDIKIEHSTYYRSRSLNNTKWIRSKNSTYKILKWNNVIWNIVILSKQK